MGILNRPSDGLPSVLVVLVRTLREKGPMARNVLEALVAPASLEDVHTGFKKGEKVRQTLNRWLQIGLFEESSGKIGLADGYLEGPTNGSEGLRQLGRQLCKLALEPSNNEDLARSEPGKTADFTHALCWMLIQDPFLLATGTYEDLVNRIENDQFQEQPWAFQNDTRWAGFREWAPLMGFGWSSRVPRPNTFIVDPTVAINGVLPAVFGTRKEMDQASFFRLLAEALPVVDGGSYRSRVEERLVAGKWREMASHEVSPSLSLSMLRLEESGILSLASRSDAPHRTLLGRGFDEVRKVSHIHWKTTADA